MSGSLAATAQTTIRVPADQPTIQSGINAAQNGDTVLVAPGTYNENLDFKGKSITVTTGATSFADATAVVVNGTADGPGKRRDFIVRHMSLSSYTVFCGVQGSSYCEMLETKSEES
jgi:hypothetical protein